MKMDYNSGTSLDYKVGIKGEMKRGDVVIREIEMMPETALTVESRYQGNIDKDYLQLLPKFALQYDFARNRGNVYATVSKGYRSGGYNVQMFSDLLQSSLKNDMMRQSKEAIMQRAGCLQRAGGQILPRCGRESGCKIRHRLQARTDLELRNRNTLESAGRTSACRRRHLLAGNPRPADFTLRPKRTGTRNGKCRKSRSQGAEVALTAAVATDFTLNASYGYTYATFKDYITNEKVNGELQEISYNGKSVPFVPKHTMSGWAVHLPHPSGALAGPHPAERQLHWCRTHLLDREEYREPSLLRHAERTYQFPERTWAD